MPVSPLPPGLAPTPSALESGLGSRVALAGARPGALVIDALVEQNAMGRTQGLLAGGAAPAAPAEVIHDLKQALEHLPFDISAILKVLMENAKEIRQSNALASDSALTARLNALMKSAADSKTAADFRLCAGVVQGVLQGAMAAHQAYASAQATLEAAKGMAPQQEAKQLQADAKALNSQAEQLELQARSAPAADAAATAADEILTDNARATADQDASVPLEDFLADAPRSAEQLQGEARTMRQQAEDASTAAAEKDKEVEAINARADGIRRQADLNTKLFDGLIGQPASAFLKFSAETLDLQAKDHEIDASKHESQGTKAKEASQHASEILRDALQKLEAIQNAHSQGIHAIARNLGS